VSKKRTFEITLKYDGPCIVCGQVIPAGEKAMWQKGVGVAHVKHFSTEELRRDGLLSPYAEEKK
jgi:hypothetical protein